MTKDTKPTLKPKRRFPEFLEGPDWQEEPMGKLYSFKGNNSLSRDKLNYERGTVRNIHYGDIHTKFSTHFDITKEVVPFVNPSESLEGFRPDNDCVAGDMIFADASEDLEDIGKSIEIVHLNGERVVSGLHTILARPEDKKLAVGFGGHLFKSRRVRSQIQRESQGAKVLGISATRLTKILLPLPPDPAEQQKIAECLSTLAELIGAESQKLDALKAHKKGLMQQLFPREGETLPRLRFAEFQDAPDWKSDSLGKMFDTASGGTPSRSERAYWGGTIPWITTSLVDFRVITGAEEFITAEGLENSSAKLFPKGTVLMAMYGQGKTRGQVALLGLQAATNQACAAILPREDVDPYFVFLSLAGRYEEIREMSNSGGQENLSQELVRKIPFSFPTDEAEQRKVTSCLSSFDDLIAAQSDQLEALKTHKKGLMQQLFPSSEAVNV